MKYVMSVVLAAALVVAVAYPTLAETPAIKKVEYEGYGRVDVEFVRDVEYRNAEVTVSDANGNSYTPILWELDEDDLSFSVENLVEGTEYSFTVSGVRSGYKGEYEAVNGSFVVPEAGALTVKSFDYDADDGELEIKFHNRVEFKEPAVEIKDASGNSYPVKVRELDRKSIELRVSGLEYGQEYTANISGVFSEGGVGLGSISANFVAR